MILTKHFLKISPCLISEQSPQLGQYLYRVPVHLGQYCSPLYHGVSTHLKLALVEGRINTISAYFQHLFKGIFFHDFLMA